MVDGATTVDAACAMTAHSALFVTTEVLLGVGVVAVVVVAVVLLRRYWDSIYEKAVKKIFNDIDVDNSGSIMQDELWAGLYDFFARAHAAQTAHVAACLAAAVGLRQQNIPADPPSRAEVSALLRNVDANRDGQLNLAEFEQVMKALGTQAFGRAVMMLVFVAVWPVLVSVGYSAAVGVVKAHDVAAYLPPVVFCVAGFVDDLHLLPMVVTILGFVLVAPRVIRLVDTTIARLCGTQSAWVTDDAAEQRSSQWAVVRFKVPRWLIAWRDGKGPRAVPAVDPASLLPKLLGGAQVCRLVRPPNEGAARAHLRAAAWGMEAVRSPPRAAASPSAPSAAAPCVARSAR
eukprot:4945519-Prymnesium_polylepis.1